MPIVPLPRPAARSASMRGFVDWKNTLTLPKTEFPMRADLARREPLWLKRWADDKQYERVLAAREAAKAEPYVLHDGPPYPTGGIHYGTLLNKVLKDIIVRSRLLMGKAARFVPGWDCHGLPIEQQVEKQFGAKAKLDTREFRQRCEAHARKFVDVMRADFRRLGCVGTWDEPYLTLNKEYEATIVRVMAAFAAKGLLYRAKRPVHWCTTHQTALAEAEVEYADHASPSIFVRFPVVPGQTALEPILGKSPAALVIWTTTPWTLAANLAIVANPDLAYVAIPVERASQPREFLIVARELADGFLAACGISAGAKETWVDLAGDKLRGLRGLRYQHPFIAVPKSDKDFRLTFASHATLDAGTGLVHRARSRRRRLCRGPRRRPGRVRAGGWPRPLHRRSSPVGRHEGVRGQPEDRGSPVRDWLPAQQARRANQTPVPTLLALQEPGAFPRHQPVVRAPGRPWRQEQPAPASARRNRSHRMDPGVGPRSHSRHDRGAPRLVPVAPTRVGRAHSRLPFKKCDEPFLEERAMEFVANVFATEGSSAWFSRPINELAPAGTVCPRCHGTDFDKTHDIVDVWFESGVSWPRSPTASWCPRGPRSTSTSKAPTNTVAGSTPRCSPPSPRADRRPTKRC